MRRVIKGKVYDTETAELICDLAGVDDRRNFCWHDTGLYKSPKGAFFLAGQGGPLSMWAKRTGSDSWEGSGIRVIDKDHARSIAEENGVSPELMDAVGFAIEEG